MIRRSLNQSDNQDYNNNFLTGMLLLWGSKYEQAAHFFLKAVYKTDPLEANYCVYLSYLVLSEVLMDHKNVILHHCYHSINAPSAIEPEVQLNLACAEFIKGDRKRAFQTMDNVDELVLSPQNSEEIQTFFELADKREKNDQGLLKRNQFINKFMGKYFRKKEIFDTENIESFIIEVAKKRYKNTIPKQLI